VGDCCLTKWAIFHLYQGQNTAFWSDDDNDDDDDDDDNDDDDDDDDDRPFCTSPTRLVIFL